MNKIDYAYDSNNNKIKETVYFCGVSMNWIEYSELYCVPVRYTLLVKSKKECTCLIQDLMIRGCKCGYMTVERTKSYDY